MTAPGSCAGRLIWTRGTSSSQRGADRLFRSAVLRLHSCAAVSGTLTAPNAADFAVANPNPVPFRVVTRLVIPHAGEARFWSAVAAATAFLFGPAKARGTGEGRRSQLLAQSKSASRRSRWEIAAPTLRSALRPVSATVGGGAQSVRLRDDANGNVPEVISVGAGRPVWN
jgi:hypothetical protein